MQATIKTITPFIAGEYLKTSSGNRSLNARHVNFLTREITSGRWVPTGTPIQFDTNGSLIDGHHRLNAVIQADTPISCFIINGVPHEAYTVIDTGKVRSGADTLSMNNIPNATQVTALIKYRFNLVNGRAVRGGGSDIKYFTNAQLLAAYNERPEYWQDILKDGYHLQNKYKLMSITLVAALLSYIKDHNQPTTFIEAVLSNDSSVINSRVLFNFFINSKLANKKLSPNDIAQYVLKYHNYFLVNKLVKMIKPVERVVKSKKQAA